MRTFSLIAACDQQMGIGKGGTLPWRLPGELEYFHRVTSEVKDPEKRNAVVMGRKTWESIPEKRRPLAGRLNCVITRDKHYIVPEGAIIFHSIDACLEFLKTRSDIDGVFVIGGAQLFAEAIRKPACAKIYLTQVEGVFGCDTFFPDIPDSFSVQEQSDMMREGDTQYRFLTYAR